MLITPKKTPTDLSDSMQSEIFSTPKRPLRDRQFSSSPSTPTSHRRSPRGKRSDTPEKGVTFSTGSFYKPETNYLNAFERMVIGKPKVYVTPVPKEKTKSVKNKSKNVDRRRSASKSRKKRIVAKPTKQTVAKSSVKTNAASADSVVTTLQKQKTSPSQTKSLESTPTKRTSPRKSPNKISSPRMSPGKVSSPSSPLRTSPRRKRKFFISRSPSQSRKRLSNWSIGKISFAPNSKSPKNPKLISPNAKKRNLSRTSYENAATPQKHRKLSEEKNTSNEEPERSVSDESCRAIVTEENESETIVDANSCLETEDIEDESDGAETCESIPDVENIADRSPMKPAKEASSPNKCYSIFNIADGKTKGSSPSPQRLPVRSSPRRPRSSRLAKSSIAGQMVIDAGQRDLGAQQCPTCSMIYSRGDPHDELLHSRFHDKFHGSLKFTGWKKERVVGRYMEGRIILVLPSDPSFMHRKVNDVREIMDRELGFSSFDTLKNKYAAFLLYVTEDKKIVGCVTAETISHAFRILGSPDASSSPSKTVRGWYCSTEESKALCGINRIWTDPIYRRHKIATHLVDCLRGHFIYGQVLNMDDIAFSDPTEQGRAFASKYTGTETFLVYK